MIPKQTVRGILPCKVMKLAYFVFLYLIEFLFQDCVTLNFNTDVLLAFVRCENGEGGWVEERKSWSEFVSGRMEGLIKILSF